MQVKSVVQQAAVRFADNVRRGHKSSDIFDIGNIYYKPVTDTSDMENGRTFFSQACIDYNRHLLCFHCKLRSPLLKTICLW